MAEVKWFKDEKERLAYIRGQYSEFKPKVVTEEVEEKESTKKKGRNKREVQAN